MRRPCDRCYFTDEVVDGLCPGCRSELARVGYLTDEKWHGVSRKPASSPIPVYDGGFQDEGARVDG